MKVRYALAALSIVIVACNALTGVGSLAVDTEDGGLAVVEAGPAPTTTTTSMLAPPAVDAGVADAALDADATVDASLPPNVGVFDGHRYEVVVAAKAIDWDDATTASAEKGGHLATITSVPEKDFVAQLVVASSGAPNGYGPWLGGFKTPQATTADGAPPDPAVGWTWITGEPWAYTNWDLGQPDNASGDEAYLGGLGDAEVGTWNDFPEDGNGYVFSYVIEYE